MIKTYKYKLYKSKKLKNIYNLINLSASIYNHCIALHKRYYKLYHKSLNKFVLQSHITKLKKLSKYERWNNLGSQAIQEITERIDNGYCKFFRKENKRPPTFKKTKEYKSFKLKGTVGYKIKSNILSINGKNYKFFLSRKIDGKIKTLSIKRDKLGDVYIYLSIDRYKLTPFLQSLYISFVASLIQNHTTTLKTAGMDFGLRTFLTTYDGETNNEVLSPLYFMQKLNLIRKFHKNLSKKKKGSNHRKQSVLNLARLYKKISNQRTDFFFKLANALSIYDYIFLEDLNLKAMQRLWGRKVSDVSYAKFVKILEQKTNVIKVNRFYPSSKTCSGCGYIYNNLSLKERQWICPECGIHHNRDINAAINIYIEGLNVLRDGASSLGVGRVRRTLSASVVDTRIPCL